MQLFRKQWSTVGWWGDKSTKGHWKETIGKKRPFFCFHCWPLSTCLSLNFSSCTSLPFAAMLPQIPVFSFSRGLVRVYQQRKADSSLSFVPSPTLKQDLLKNPKYWDREKKMQWFLEAFCSEFKLEESTMASSITSEQDRSGSFVRFFFCNFQWKLPIHVSNIEKGGGNV